MPSVVLARWKFLEIVLFEGLECGSPAAPNSRSFFNACSNACCDDLGSRGKSAKALGCTPPECSPLPLQSSDVDGGVGVQYAARFLACRRTALALRF